MDSLQSYFKQDQFAGLAGIELLEAANGKAKAVLTLSAKHLNSHHAAHGGAIFTLADFAFAAASNAHGTVAVGINANITYMKAVRTGRLTAEAREISRTPKLATYTVEVTDEAGDLVAIFQGLAYRKKDLIHTEAIK
jgi:acyl-CoA thioesterase